MKYSFLLALIILLSCNNERTFKYKGFDMESTIPFGTKITLKKTILITNNSIVAFKLPGSNEIKILRVVGSPGDEVDLYGGQVYVNKNKINFPSSSKSVFMVYIKNAELFRKLENYSFSVYSPNYSTFSLSNKEYNEIVNMKIVDSIYTLPIDSNQIQSDILRVKKSKFTNSYYFGPIIIPKKNDIIDDYVLSVIPTFLSPKDLGKKIDDDYFFCLGDNFPEAKDSRYIGLVPRSSIMGIVDSFHIIKSIEVSPN